MLVQSVEKLLKGPWALRLAGALALSALIWMVGPDVAVRKISPLEPLWARLLATAAPVVVIGVWWLLERQRLRRREMAIQSELAKEAQAATDDVRKIESGFERALQDLRTRSAKRGDNYLYSRPWYAMIGPPLSGKTTALRAANLDGLGPGDPRIAGAGGTRNCEWIFADNAVLIDTAGRFTTQDSSKEADSREWLSFLRLLKRHRPRQPLNGVLAAIPAPLLLAEEKETRIAIANKIRSRVEELNETLGLSLPIYVVVTKADKLAGFAEFFEESDNAAEGEVLGFTFPIADSRSGAAVAGFDKEFEALARSLAGRLLSRFDRLGARAHRARAFGFLQEFANVRAPLLEAVSAAFRTEGGAPPLQLRGVYFTSALQDASPIDRLLAAFGGSTLDGGAPAPTSRALFLRRLFTDVVFAEAGLAGVDPAVEKRSNGLHYAAASLVIAITSATLLAWALAYRSEVADVKRLGEDATEFAHRAPSSMDLASIIRRLNALTELSQAKPKGFRFGLGQSAVNARRVRMKYALALEAWLVPEAMDRLRTRIEQDGLDDDQRYDALAAYIRAGGACRDEVGPESIVRALSASWGATSKSSQMLEQDYARHADALFGASAIRPDRAEKAASAYVDTTSVVSARARLSPADPSRLAYLKLRRAAGDEKVTLASLAGEGARNFFQDPEQLGVPAMFTATYVQQKLLHDVDAELDRRSGIDCVRDVKTPAGAEVSRDRILEHYFDDFVATWDAFLASVRARTASSAFDDAVNDIGQMIRKGDGSPLRAFVAGVAEKTDLGDRAPVEKSDASPTAEEISEAERIASDHFKVWRDAASGGLDEALTALKGLRDTWQNFRDAPASGKREAIEELKDAAKALDDASGALPLRVGDWLGAYTAVAVADARSGGAAAMKAAVKPLTADCVKMRGKFPFNHAATAAEAGPGDFETFFAEGGSMDEFFEQHLREFIDAPNYDVNEQGKSVNIRPALANSFRQMEKVRKAYFEGSKLSVRLQIVPRELSGAKSATMQIYEKSIPFSGQPTSGESIEWTGDEKGDVIVTFDKSGKTRPYSSAWALFRFLSDAECSASSDRTSTCRVSVGAASLTFDVVARKSDNPVINDPARGFVCPAM